MCFYRGTLNATYFKGITWSIVDEKELPVCGTSPDTMVSLGHKPCDAAKTVINIRKGLSL